MVRIKEHHRSPCPSRARARATITAATLFNCQKRGKKDGPRESRRKRTRSAAGARANCEHLSNVTDLQAMQIYSRDPPPLPLNYADSKVLPPAFSLALPAAGEPKEKEKREISAASDDLHETIPLPLSFGTISEAIISPAIYQPLRSIIERIAERSARE